MSSPIYSEILARRYGDFEWTILGNNYSSLVFHTGTLPSQAELDALWSSVETEIILEGENRLKEIRFQLTYSIQTQLIALMRGDTALISEMLNHWETT